MLIQFSIKNYKTFKERATISFIASNYDKKTREKLNVYKSDFFNLRILKSAAVYGANASGKSKLIDAINLMKTLVLSSSKDSQKGEKINATPFLLSDETAKEPCEFEVCFLYKKQLYRYGFEVNKTNIISEWLYYKPKTKEIELFYRENNSIDTHDRLFSKGAMIKKENLIRNNALLLSVAAQFNDELAGNVLNWFQELGVISGVNELGYKAFTMNQIMQQEKREKILKLLTAADLGITDIHVEKMKVDTIPKNLPNKIKKKISDDITNETLVYLGNSQTTHHKYNSDNEFVGNVNFSLEDDESQGTQKFFYLLGPILDSIENGKVLFIDELDARLHPNLVEKIVSLFNSSEVNKKNAQLIFNTHDTKIINSKILRKDQLWFIEKDNFGAAKLYSLSDFKANQVKKSDDFEKNYLDGRYGAIPYLNSLESEFLTK